LALSILSWFAPRLLGLNRVDSTAINIEATVRNGNLGLLIKASLFPAVVGVADPVGDMVLFTVLLYGGLALPAGVAQIYLHGYFNRKLQACSDPP
jgi:BASS family bile acid:Na+ symporter